MNPRYEPWLVAFPGGLGLLLIMGQQAIGIAFLGIAFGILASILLSRFHARSLDEYLFESIAFRNAVRRLARLLHGARKFGLLVAAFPVQMVRPSRGRKICSAPGWALHRFGSWVFAPSTFASVLEPVLSDLQIEVQAALLEGRPFKARWRQLCGYWRFWSHVSAVIPVSTGRTLVEIWRLIGS